MMSWQIQGFDASGMTTVAVQIQMLRGGFHPQRITKKSGHAVTYRHLSDSNIPFGESVPTPQTITFSGKYLRGVADRDASLDPDEVERRLNLMSDSGLPVRLLKLSTTGQTQTYVPYGGSGATWIITDMTFEEGGIRTLSSFRATQSDGTPIGIEETQAAYVDWTIALSRTRAR